MISKIISYTFKKHFSLYFNKIILALYKNFITAIPRIETFIEKLFYFYLILVRKSNLNFEEDQILGRPLILPNNEKIKENNYFIPNNRYLTGKNLMTR